jgi:ABC-type sugar transport system substrate-binding protein
MAHSKKPKKKSMVVGIGLDSDGHKRVTTGPNFALLGGTQDTHEVMTEKAIKINEKLAQKGKTLDEVSAEEFEDIAQSVGLQRRIEKKDDGKPGNENH